jgi:hypothetical protein
MHHRIHVRARPTNIFPIAHIAEDLFNTFYPCNNRARGSLHDPHSVALANQR